MTYLLVVVFIVGSGGELKYHDEWLTKNGCADRLEEIKEAVNEHLYYEVNGQFIKLEKVARASCVPILRKGRKI